MESCGSWLEELLTASTNDGVKGAHVSGRESGGGGGLTAAPCAGLRVLARGLGLGRRLDMMWFSQAELKDTLFTDLMNECRHAAPGAMLSYQLRSKMQRLSIEERKNIVGRVKGGCAPLFIACMRGHVDIVEYLIKTCGADMEQRGLYEVPNDQTVHCVTPLWCAAVAGKLNVIKCLVELGADVNAASDSGSTPVRSACFMTHMEIVKFLVENGADIMKQNHNGGTCLINSVQSASLCLFLLKNGASVNQCDIQNKTALHYAIQEHRCETTQLLLRHGADPYARSRVNDDALRIACIKGAKSIFEYLRETVTYEPERLADAYELMGSTLLDEHNDTHAALQNWRKALDIRWANTKDGLPLPKSPIIPTREAFRYAREFVTQEDLNNISLDMDAMRMQSLLICERVLGEQHKDTLFRLMYRGAAYADALRYQRCIDLWRRALEVRVARDSVLSSDTCYNAQALVRLFVDLNEKILVMDHNEREEGALGEDDGPRFFDICEVFQLLGDELPGAQKLLEIQPVNKRQQESYDRVLRCLTHLIYLLVKRARSKEEKSIVDHLVCRLIRSNPCSATTCDTLLHLCVSRLNTIKSSYFADDNQVIFPNIEVIMLLLRCGASVNARNQSRSTPLHIASNPYNFDSQLVKLLLDHGAHLDLPNRSGDCPSQSLSKNICSQIHLVNYITLRCLSAKAVIKHGVPYHGRIPATLENFVSFHCP